MPLKKIPSVISPDLLKVLALMGHGDEIVFADAHFPSSSICKNGPTEVRADGLDIPTLLDAVLELLPLDQYVDFPVALMDLVQSDKDRNLQTPVWVKYREIINKHESDKPKVDRQPIVCAHCLKENLIHFNASIEIQIEKVERFAFYDRAKKAFAVVHTGETALYGNIILKKGLAV